MTGSDEQPSRADDEAVSVADLVRDVALALHDGDGVRAAQLVINLHPRDLADVIELLSGEHRVALIQALGPAFNYEVLSEIDEAVRDQLSEALPNELLARAVTELDTDDAAYLIENLEQEDRDEILAQLTKGDRAALERQLDYPEDSAGRLMQSDFVAVAPFWTVGQVIDSCARRGQPAGNVLRDFRRRSGLPRGRQRRAVAAFANQARCADVGDHGNRSRHLLATADQEEVARDFERYDLYSAPVVDDNGKLVGVITVDDIVEVIQDEADEDMRALGGVGDERLGDSVLQTRAAACRG